MMALDPHKYCELHYGGARLDQARLVVVAAHGRYGVAGDILKFADEIDVPNVAWVAPEAACGSWWTKSFLAPLALNEPGLSSAIARVSSTIAMLEQRGFGPDQIVLTGFSQGACLVLEYIARKPKSFRGVVAMSGGLIGTADGKGEPSDALYGHMPKQFEYSGDLSGVPIHIGCHTEDPVIPIARVQHSGTVLRAMGAKVTVTPSDGRMHGALPSDISCLRDLLTA